MLPEKSGNMSVWARVLKVFIWNFFGANKDTPVQCRMQGIKCKIIGQYVYETFESFVNVVHVRAMEYV